MGSTVPWAWVPDCIRRKEAGHERPSLLSVDFDVASCLKPCGLGFLAKMDCTLEL